MANDQGYVELVETCDNICKVIERGMGEKKLDELSESVRGAIDQLNK